MENENKSEAVEQLYVCTGSVVLTGGKLGKILRPVGEDGSLGDERYYGAKGLRGFHVGGVWSIPTNGTSITVGKARYVRRWEKAEDVTTWTVKSRAAEAEIAARKKQKTDAALVAALPALDPLRRLYFKTNAANRIAIEVVVLAYLRRQTNVLESEDAY